MEPLSQLIGLGTVAISQAFNVGNQAMNYQRQRAMMQQQQAAVVEKCRDGTLPNEVETADGRKVLVCPEQVIR